MDYAYGLSRSVPLVRKYRIGITIPNAGAVLIAPGAGNAGVVLGSTTGAANMVGSSIDTGTYATAQVAGGTADATVSVIINPDAVWRLLMSGGATEGTALALQTVTTAASDGLSVTTAAEWSNPTYDEGYVWGFDGANAGQSRKITSVSSTAGTVTVAFDNDTVVGDNFLRCPYSPLQTSTIQLTTLLTQADASIAVGTGAALRTVELQLRDNGSRGRTNSYVFAVSDDHIFNVTT